VLCQGFAHARRELLEAWQQTMRSYLMERGSPTLRVLLVLDARQSLRGSDRDFLHFLDREANVRFHVVMSKCDLVPREELAKRCAAAPAPRLQPLQPLQPLHLGCIPCTQAAAPAAPAPRYTMLTHELSELQLRRWRRPLHMVSSRTSAGVTGAPPVVPRAQCGPG